MYVPRLAKQAVDESEPIDSPADRRNREIARSVDIYQGHVRGAARLPREAQAGLHHCLGQSFAECHETGDTVLATRQHERPLSRLCGKARDVIERDLERRIDTAPAARIAASMTAAEHEPEKPPTASSETWRRCGRIGAPESPRPRQAFRAISPVLAISDASGTAAKNTLCCVSSLLKSSSCSSIVSPPGTRHDSSCPGRKRAASLLLPDHACNHRRMIGGDRADWECATAGDGRAIERRARLSSESKHGLVPADPSGVQASRGSRHGSTIVAPAATWRARARRVSKRHFFILGPGVRQPRASLMRYFRCAA